MRISVFASGSSGNCAFFACDGMSVLIDAGISARRICSFLAAEGLSVSGLDGILITHEHTDHIAGLATLVRRYATRIYAPEGVAAGLAAAVPGAAAYIEVIRPGEPFALGAGTAVAFRTLHDTPESVGYRLDTPGGSFGACTDLGCVTDDVLDGLCGVDAALIEANHDETMLRYGPYPPALKRRILSPRGHLSNEDCGKLASALAESGAGTIVLGHLSRENNTPERAFSAVESALRERGLSAELYVAPPLGPLSLGEGVRCSA